jgi:hypothetical protein
VTKENSFAPIPRQTPLLFAPSSLAPIHELNGHFLRILLEAASNPGWAGTPWGLALGTDLANILPAVQADLARSPISLVEFTYPPTAAGPPAQIPISQPQALELTQVALTLAWTLARSDMALSCLVFGFSRSAGRVLAATSAPEVQIATRMVAQCLRPRWMADPRIWRQMLHDRPRESERAGPLYVRLLLRQFAERDRATCANDEVRHGRL